VATLVIALILPVILVGAITVNIVRLIRDRAQRQAGARLKTRLILFFTLVAILALIPQAILSTTFIDSAITFWVGAGMGESLEGSLTISLAYHTDKVRNLSSFVSSPMLPRLLSALPAQPDVAWSNLRDSNPEIGFLQVFDSEGQEIIFRGDPNARIDDFDTLRADAVGSPIKTTRGDTTVLRVIVPESAHHLGSIAPVSSGAEPTVVMGIVYPREFDELASRITSSRRLFKQLFRYQEAFRKVIVAFYFLFSVPILLLAILVSFVLTEDIMRPIAHLERATRRVADGDFSFRLLSRRGDELSALVESFNRMVGELDRSRRKLVQAEKHAAWREIAQRLAHEIRNPLTPIKLSAQRILRRAGRGGLDEVLERSVSAIIKEVDNLNHLLVEFREFTRLPELQPETVDVQVVLDEVLLIYANLSSKVRFESHYHTDRTRLRADRTQLKRAFANLIKNSVQATSDGGSVVITTDLVTKNQKSYLRVQIQDTGLGIVAEAREKVFEPYFTTKRDGSGLGLAIVERIIFDHNGTIWFESEEGAGTTFFVDLPVDGA
jgi:nitrogen fixation/metabolism regulation signal transduction histidine kinase